jgi:pimeloyl-ACP methyl ester carboxylesterase
MQEKVRTRSNSIGRNITRLLGLSFASALVFTAIVDLRHILDTPQRLESPLPGEANYYKWGRGHIFYKVLGMPEAPPLLLLHTPEIAASAYEMRKIMEPLAQHYRVYAPDLLGFGLSDRPSIDYSAEMYVDLCRDFLTDVIKQPATIVASKISCNYAVTTAATSPGLCTRLVLISPVALEGIQEKALSQEGSRLPLLIRDTSIPMVNTWSELLQTAPVKWLLYPILSTRFALRYLLARQDARLSAADLNYFYATTHQFGAQHATMALLAGKLAQDVSPQLEAVQQTSLVIWGAKGLSNPGRIDSQWDITGTMPYTRLALLPDAGLAVHEEHPEMLVATILQWSEEGKASVVPPLKTTIEAYCMKCKVKRGMLNPTEVTLKNGRPALRGTCEVCGTSLFRIGRAEQETP